MGAGRLNATILLTRPPRTNRMNWAQKQKWNHARTLRTKPRGQHIVFPCTTSSIMLFLVHQYERNPTKTREQMMGVGWFMVWADTLDATRASRPNLTMRQLWFYARTLPIIPTRGIGIDTFPGTNLSTISFLRKQYNTSPSNTREQMAGIGWFGAWADELDGIRARNSTEMKRIEKQKSMW